MNFREHKKVKARCITALSASKLQAEVNKFCNGVELVDLQYSSHGVSTYMGNMSETYSVFILYKEKGE